MNINDDQNTVQRGMYAGSAPAGWADTTAGPLETHTAAGPKDSHYLNGAIVSVAAVWDEDQGVTLTITRDADDHQEIGGLTPEQARQIIASMQHMLADPAVASSLEAVGQVN
ncbi:hypothetical protein [Arthrobacter sp. B1805]|uniref:hypothetical protein n=1 Tax=Arthrobacter sp. B1805 TaxID=2058892 RepID=UPI000CE449F0|nr:hypothetical protein [Arthrobacter sp. B1805]